MFQRIRKLMHVCRSLFILHGFNLGRSEGRTNVKGLSIIEVLVAMAIFSSIASTITFLIIDSYSSEAQTYDYTIATQYAQEGIEAVVSIKEEEWSTVFAKVGQGPQGLDKTTGYWEFNGLENNLDKYSRIIEIKSVYRDNAGVGNIVDQSEVGAVLDQSTLKIEVTVSWTEPHADQITVSEYITDWQIAQWTEDVQTDFTDGTLSQTAVSGSSGDGNGSVILGVTGAGGETFQCVSDSTTKIDLSGNSDSDSLDGFGTKLLITQSNQVRAYDVTIPSAPVLQGNITIAAPATGSRLTPDGNYLVAISGSNNNEMQIVDVTNPASIPIVGSFNLPGNFDALGIFVDSSTRAYVVTQNNTGGTGRELYIMNITNKAAPTIVSSVEIGANTYEVFKNGNYIYVATDDPAGEFKIINATIEAAPVVVGSVNLPGSVTLKSVTFKGDYAYTTSGLFLGNIYVLNVANPLLPTLSSTITETSSDFNRIRVFGNYLFAAGNKTGEKLFIYDVTNPATPIKQTSKDYDAGLRDVWVSGSNIFVSSTANTAELGIFASGSVDNWACLEQKGNINITDTADAEKIFVRQEGVDIIGYIIRGFGLDNQLITYNLNNPASPVQLGTFSIPSQVKSIFVNGNYAYLASADDAKEMIIVNVTNLVTMVEAGSFNIPGTEDSTDIFVSGSRAYITRGNNNTDAEFYVINITNPAVPVLASPTSFYESGETYSSLVVNGNFAYIASSQNTSELTVLNLTNESSISYQGGYDMTGNTDANEIWHDPSDVGYVYISNSNGNAVSIINVTNPAAPTLISSIALSGQTNSIAKNGNYLFLGTAVSAEEVKVYNISTKASPLFLSNFSNSSIPAKQIYFFNNYIYLASGDDNQEIKIVGRTSTGGSSGTYFTSGSYTSNAFDTGGNASYNSISWTESNSSSPCLTCDIQVQVRTAPDNAGAPGTWTSWYGETGENTYFTNPTGTSIPNDVSGNRWVQYRVEFTGTTLITPILSNITIVFK